MTNCPRCGSGKVISINMDNTVFECLTCNHRSHIHGIASVDVEYNLDERAIYQNPYYSIFDGKTKNG